MGRDLKLSVLLNTTPEKLYNAWLSSEEHSAFTESPAEIDNKVGGRFTAWEGYITGTTLELHPFTKIVQSWRTTEFPEGSEDSRLVIEFEPLGDKTKMTLTHTLIPEGQEAEYKTGWIDYYFEPMQRYFK